MRVCSVLLAIVAVLSAGCAPTITSPRVAGTALEAWQSSLRFTAAADVAEVPSGTSFTITATLTNIGAEAIHACLRDPLQYNLWGSSNIAQRISLVDHRSCETLLDLEPQQSVSWSVPVTVDPKVGVGPARLTLLVDLLYAYGCHPLYGCYHRTLHTEPFRFVISPAALGGA